MDVASLRSRGLANGRGDGIKILGGGELTKKANGLHTLSARLPGPRLKARVGPAKL